MTYFEYIRNKVKRRRRMLIGFTICDPSRDLYLLLFILVHCTTWFFTCAKYITDPCSIILSSKFSYKKHCYSDCAK